MLYQERNRLVLAEKGARDRAFFCGRIQSKSVGLGLDRDVADAADDVVSGGLAFFHWNDGDGVGLVVGTKNEGVLSDLKIFDGASAIFADGVHVLLVLAVRGERVVVAVDENGGAG